MVITLDDTQALTQLFPVKPGEEPEPLAGRAPYTHRLELSDGGVYDNLGLQPVEQMHTVLVSDGGGPFEFEEDVAVNWLSHMIRAWKVTDRQVRALRRAGLVAEFKRDERFGAFWSIQTDYQSYPDRRLPVHEEWADYLASIPTRLTTVPVDQRKQLINWAYSLTDAALRSFVAPGITPDPVWPYPENPLDVAPTVASKPWWKRW
jgi:NTE family protein